jgi:hypothetical protein
MNNDHTPRGDNVGSDKVSANYYTGTAPDTGRVELLSIARSDNAEPS